MDAHHPEDEPSGLLVGPRHAAHDARAAGVRADVDAGRVVRPEPDAARQGSDRPRPGTSRPRPGITIETRKAEDSNAALRNGATAIGLLVALGVLAMTVGLIRSETANDLRTLAAAGATSTIRRTITSATAGTLALLGALLGTGGAYLALVAWHRGELHVLTRVPYLDLVVIIVGLPLLAIAAGWILAGREPASIAHQPLE